jgi:hypothetical protein
MESGCCERSNIERLKQKRIFGNKKQDLTWICGNAHKSVFTIFAVHLVSLCLPEQEVGRA